MFCFSWTATLRWQMRTKKEECVMIISHFLMCGLTVWTCCVCKRTFSPFFPPGLQEGELSVLGDKSQQGRLAARSSRHGATPDAPWSASSGATPRSKYKHYNTVVVHTRPRSVPEQVRGWKPGCRSVKALPLCSESSPQRTAISVLHATLCLVSAPENGLSVLLGNQE